MRTSVIAVLASTSLLTACPSPEALCKSGVDQICERTFECQPQDVRATALFQAVFGTSVSDCKTRLYANPGALAGQTALACENVETDAQLCTNLGYPGTTDFDLGAAQDCRDRRADLSCTAYLAQLADPALAPAQCSQRCR